jgi:hypothetical protein
VLSFHADYRCQHTGRCCTSNWPIQIDGTDEILERVHGRCVFHDTHASGGCQIQRATGHESIPLACRQFPRQTVTDPRGTSVTLSHYCPTAQGQLERATGPVTIVDGGSAFPRHGEYIGLEASPDVPPLLHPRCLITWDQWWQIEARAVTLVTEHPESALPRLAHAIEHLHAWQPGTTPLGDGIHRAFDLASICDTPKWEPTPEEMDAHVADALSAIPAEWQDEATRALTPGRTQLPWPMFGRFLAAHTFANWAAYNGMGLRTWFRSIEAAGCLVWRTGDPGNVDLILRHLADSSALITRWNQAERRPVIRRT